MPTNLRHDFGSLRKLCTAIDEIQETIERRWSEGVRPVELFTAIADLRDYFLFLTLDALDDADLARELVEAFERLEEISKTHQRFFFALSQLLSLRHGIRKGPGERIGREDFERSWKETARIIGVEG
jgi:hypothetical protein